jgi:FkbM family methyltransferase
MPNKLVIMRILKFIYDFLPFKKNIFYLLRLFKLPYNIIKHLHFKGVFKVKVESRDFLIMHYGYQIENELFWYGLLNGWEKISMKIWIDLCKDSQVIFDIGANTGVYSLVAKTLSPKSQVYGFEPVERVFQKFKYNNELNKFDVFCCDFAISNQDGEAIIYEVPSEHVYSVTVNKNTTQNVNATSTKIKTKKLSTFIKEQKIEKVDLIKIDVETHEPEVLEGMEAYLHEYKPTLLIEILNDDVGRKVQDLLKGIDYLFFNIDEIGPPKMVTKIVKSDYYNYLICRKEIAQKLNLL